MNQIVIGLNDLIKNIDRVDKDFNRKVFLPAIRKGLNIIAKQAKANCKWQSLRKLISKKAFISKKDKNAKGKVFLRPSKDRTIKLEGREVGFEVVGNILEFGSVKQNIKPHPFMRPARDHAAARARFEMEKEAEKRLKML